MKRRLRRLLHGQSHRATRVEADQRSVRTSNAEPVLWELFPRLGPLRFWVVVVGVALAPVGIMGPWDDVWFVVGSLMLVATILGPVTRSAIINVGLAAIASAYVALSLLWSPERNAGIPIATALAIWVATYLGVSAAAADLRLTRVLRVVATLWTFGIGIGLIVVSSVPLSIKGIEWDWPIRHAAMAGVALAALSLTTRKGRRLAGLGALTLLVGILVSEARTALVALLLVMIAIGVSWVTPRIRTLGTIVLLAGLALAVLTPALQSRIAGGDTLQTVTSGRSDAWAATWNACDSWGRGEGAGFADTVALTVSDQFSDPQNEYLRFGCDIGPGLLPIIGFALFSVARSFSLLGARSNSRIGIAALAGIGTLGIFSGFWNPLTALEYMVPLMAIIALADKSLETMQEHGYLETRQQ
jgi:O-Antigen ligase